VIVPALLTLAASMIFAGDFDEGERWLQRAGPALEADAGPGIRLLGHIVSGMLQVGRCCLHEAVKEFDAAESLGSRLTGSVPWPGTRDSTMALRFPLIRIVYKAGAGSMWPWWAARR